MGYIARERFVDLIDARHLYEAGEPYPRPGYTPSDERIKQLAGSDNRMGYPLIEPDGHSDAPSPVDGEIPAPDAKPAQKRRRTAKKG